MRRIFSIMLSCVIVFSSICVNVSAADAANPGDYVAMETISMRASGTFEMSVNAYKRAEANTAFPLAAGETVRIRANYSPENVSVDFGLVDPEGVFHYINITTGSIDATITVPENGNYTFAVRNNSSQTVKITGIVNY